MSPPTTMRPGPPHYTYAATITRVHDGGVIIAEIGLGHIGRGLTPDKDFGFGIRRLNGWLIWAQPIHLAGIVVRRHGGREALEAMFTTPKIIIQTRWAEVGRIEAEVWPFGEVKSVNERLVEDGWATPTL